MPKVFISHSSQDRDFAEREIVQPLASFGVTTWYAKDDIQPSALFERTIAEGLKTCDWFLVILSPRSAQSEWVRDEVNWAIDQRPGKVIPVLMEECNSLDFHIRLPRIQHISFLEDKQQSLRSLLKRLGIDDLELRELSDQKCAEGLNHMIHGCYDESIAACTEAIRLFPNWHAYYARGWAHNTAGVRKRAIEDLSEAVRLEPKFAKGYRMRGRAHYDEGNYEEAISDFTQTLRLQSDFTELYELRGNAYSFLGQYDQAIADFSHAIELNPENCQVLWSRRAAYERLGQMEHANADSERLRSVLPNSSFFDKLFGSIVQETKDNVSNGVFGLMDQGDEYLSKGDNDRAIGRYNLALQCERDDPIVGIAASPIVYAAIHRHRGLAYLSKGEYDRAIGDLTEAIRLGADISEVRASRAEAFFRNGEYDRAVADFTEAIAGCPDDARSFRNRGAAFARMEKYDLAIADYTEVIRIDPDSPGVFASRGDARLSSKDYDGAIADYTEATRRDSEDSLSFFKRGSAHFSKKDHEHAIADSSEAIRLNPKDSDFYLLRAFAYGATGNATKRDADYDEAKKLSALPANEGAAPE